MTKKTIITSESPEDSSLTNISDTELETMKAEIDGKAPAKPDKNTHNLQVDTDLTNPVEQANRHTHRIPGYVASDEEGYEMPASHDYSMQIGRRTRTPVDYSDTGRAPARAPAKTKAPKSRATGTKTKAVEMPTAGSKRTRTARKPAACRDDGPEDENSDDEETSRELEDRYRPRRKESNYRDAENSEPEPTMTAADMRRDIANLVGQSLRVAVSFSRYLREHVRDEEAGAEAAQLDKEVDALMKNKKRKANMQEYEDNVLKKKTTKGRMR